MAEPVTLTLNISKVNGKPVHDHQGKHPVLHHDDALVLHKDATWAATEGIDEIRFYASRANYDSDTSFATWTPGTSQIAGKFDIAETAASNGKITDVKLTDIENLQSGEDDMYYKVQVGGKWMDPEIVNKSGTGTGRAGDHWVDNPAQ